MSVLSIIAKHRITQTDAQAANDEENAAGRNETKETNPKEFWAVSPVALPQIYISFKRIIYRDYNHTAHLAWVPSVPTPPPNV
ncbi:hypothetical protein ACFQZI_03645 [Mucilaginibacter lutimaris]|uniref:Uncharacterized protein n=1 Tax=Mucilaginibacter lutimaris TaxID=931629 RepID=A0ABW2ZAW7_9SPHI